MYLKTSFLSLSRISSEVTTALKGSFLHFCISLSFSILYVCTKTFLSSDLYKFIWFKTVKLPNLWMYATKYKRKKYILCPLYKDLSIKYGFEVLLSIRPRSVTAFCWLPRTLWLKGCVYNQLCDSYKIGLKILLNNTINNAWNRLACFEYIYGKRWILNMVQFSVMCLFCKRREKIARRRISGRKSDQNHVKIINKINKLTFNTLQNYSLA